MVDIRRYQHKDLETLQYLHVTWNNTEEILKNETLPEIGYISFVKCNDTEVPIAIGFLRRVEGGLAQIDTLVSNKHLSGNARHAGLSRIISKLIEDAKDLNLLGIISFTRDLGIIKRAEALGFRVLPHQTMVLSLTKRE